ncbi:hypothetical protein AAGG49_23115, partial [Stenotrophomonas maltophilia]|uniref:hypothetical protein n=1 Tax=Stenotrophomonas maltophilia TaxID=40324 RepID=UPI00313AF23B
MLVISVGRFDRFYMGGGDDQMTVTGGAVTGVVALGCGGDVFLFCGGSMGALLLGEKMDTFRLW